MLEYKKKYHAGKWPESGCINALRTLSKIHKLGQIPDELAEMKKGKGAYCDSDEYQTDLEKNKTTAFDNKLSAKGHLASQQDTDK